MRFRLTFRLLQTPQWLPLNYKYPVSSWIYKTIEQANTRFSEFLHENGYKTADGKTFKLFTFSDFQVPRGKWAIQGDLMQIFAETIELVIAFQLPEPMQHFIVGLFLNQQVAIGNNKTQIKLMVIQVEALDDTLPLFETFTLQTLSPILVEKRVEGKKYGQYIPPSDNDYSALLINNLLDKYKAYQFQVKNRTDFYQSGDVTFKCLDTEPKHVLQTIKADQKSETRVRAYKYRFELTAPNELVKLGLNAGFGSSNALGFGCCEIM